MGMPTAIKCRYCETNSANPVNIYFETIEDYNNHIKEVHNITIEFLGTACKCPICNTYHDTCNALATHLSSVHNIT